MNCLPLSQLLWLLNRSSPPKSKSGSPRALRRHTFDEFNGLVGLMVGPAAAHGAALYELQGPTSNEQN